MIIGNREFKEIDFSKLKAGNSIEILGITFVCYVSKGRKMLQHDATYKVDKRARKKLKGYVHYLDKHYRKTMMIFDYGKSVRVDSRYWYPSESYELPEKTTSNRWDVYEYSKTTGAINKPI